MKKIILLFVVIIANVLVSNSVAQTAEATSCHRCSRISGCQMTDFESNDNCENPSGAVTRYSDPTCSQVSGGDNSMCSENMRMEANNPIGYLDSASCTQVTGWACDNDNPNYPLQIAFFKNGSYFTGGKDFGATTANLPREAAVGALCGGNSSHGFEFTVPSGALSTGDTVYAHAINIGKGTTNPVLGYSGKAVSCSSAIVPTTPPQPVQPTTFSCGRCSVVNGCEWTQFQASEKECINPLGNVTRTTDTVNCGPVSGGDNSRCPAPPIASTPNATCTGASAEATTITQVKDKVVVKAVGVKNATLVKFPTWTAYAPNGTDQDDLKWNTGTKVASDPVNGDTWQYDIPLNQYNFGSSGQGLMNVHVYMDNSSKANEWCGSANFTYAPSSQNQPQPTPPAPVCQPIPADNGSMDLLVNAPSAGAYTMWIRMMKPNDGANSIYLKTETDCPVVVSMKSGLANNSWEWVNYKNGDSNNVLSSQFKAGDQFIKLAGKDGVRVDKIMILTNGCVPTGTGDNCTSFIPPVSNDESTHNPIGWQDSASCEAISGWTCDPDEPQTALTIHVFKGASYFDGGRDIIGTVVASDDRSDLITNGNVCNGTKAHGFTFHPTPGSLQNGDKVFLHAINVGRGTTNPLIGNTGGQVTCATPNIGATAKTQNQNQIELPTQMQQTTQIAPPIPQTIEQPTPTPTPAGIVQTVLTLPAKVVQSVVSTTQSLLGHPPSPTPTPTIPQAQPNDSFVRPTLTTPVQTAASQTSLNISLQLHGIGRGGDSSNPNSGGNKNPRQRTEQVNIELLKKNRAAGAFPGRVTYDATTGLYTGTIILSSNLASDVYTVRVKVARYLKKSYPSPISITQHMLTTLPPLELITGDLNNDNKIDTTDTTIMLGCVTSGISQPKNCSATNKALTDLNDDGVVNIQDYNLLLRENKVRQGD